MRYSLLLISILFTLGVHGQQKIQLLFIGDVMGHDTQITSARIDTMGHYDYHSCFRYIRADIEAADFAIANLEVTLAGPPHKGYPQFSSPDTLADALTHAGVDAFVMANNHCVDRRRKGLERTLQILDQKGIPRTGVFSDSLDRERHNPMLIEKNGIRLALLNYTYGTNGIKVQAPNIVNSIDTALMAKDIAAARRSGVDMLIAFMHWGWEYQLSPNAEQKTITQFLWSHGVNVVIGSHPHVVQPMHWDRDAKHNRIVVYSLGNFISNQRTAPRDGGAMAMVELTKTNDSTYISDADYQLTWVYTPIENGRKKFYVLPADRFKDYSDWPDTEARERMNDYLSEAREVFKHNTGIVERRFRKPMMAIKGFQMPIYTVQPSQNI